MIMKETLWKSSLNFVPMIYINFIINVITVSERKKTLHIAPKRWHELPSKTVSGSRRPTT
jgi:hypothetical protein